MDQIFISMANKHRRSMLYNLSLRPHSIKELANKESLSLPAIYKHIKVLEDSNLILRRKSGRTNFLALNKEVLYSFQKWVMQFSAHWGTNQESLDNYIKSLEANQ